MNEESQQWKKMKWQHERMNLLKWQVARFGPAHEERVSKVKRERSCSMKGPTSSSGKRHGLVLLMRKGSQGW